MAAVGTQLRLLRNATLPDGDRVDVVLDDARVAAVEPAAAPVSRAGDVLDLTGHVLLTAPAEPHAHWDKAYSHDLIDPPGGDLALAIGSWRAHAATMPEAEVRTRARAATLALLRNGTTAVRSHVDLLAGDDPLRGVRALISLRAELRGAMDVELAALAAYDTPDDVIEAALDLGVDLVGGAPHLAPDPQEFLHRLLGIAKRRGTGVDLHTDENLTGPLTLPTYAQAALAREPGTSLTAGHCVRLSTLPAAELEEVTDAVLAADIGLVALPITNLFLQGRDHPVSTPRGLAPVRALMARGVRLGAGGDNVRDPFNPVGRSDALETAALLVAVGHLDVADAYRLTADGARSVLRLPPAGPVVGAAAELLAVRGTGLGDVVAHAPADRYVVHRGRLVAASRTVTESVV